MKKTSRRSFGKQLTGALAALPISSLALNSSAKGQTNKSQIPRINRATSNRTSHDTPPPIFLMSGSLVFEARTDKVDWDHPVQIMLGGKNGWRHKVLTQDKDGNTPGGPIHIAHIKIVDGSGEMVYRLDNDDKIPIAVKAVMNKGKTEFTTVKVDDQEREKFAIDFLNKRKLEYNKDADPASDPEKERKRVRYKDDAGNNGQIYSIEVLANDSDVLYSLKLENYKAAKELRVMIWWEV